MVLSPPAWLFFYKIALDILGPLLYFCKNLTIILSKFTKKNACQDYDSFESIDQLEEN